MGETTSNWKTVLIILGIFFVIVGIAYVYINNRRVDNNNPNACVSKTFSVGASGNCISDGQNLLNWYLYGIDQPNYMKIDGQFSSSMETAVKKTQSGASLTVNGQLDHATWKLLCQGNDAPSWWSTAAKDAGCS